MKRNEYLLVTLGLEKIKVYIELETFIQIEVESCLNLLLCRFTLSLGLFPLVVFSLNFYQIFINIVLTEIFRFSHDFDKALNVLFIATLTLATLET